MSDVPTAHEGDGDTPEPELGAVVRDGAGDIVAVVELDRNGLRERVPFPADMTGPERSVWLTANDAAFAWLGDPDKDSPAQHGNRAVMDYREKQAFAAAVFEDGPPLTATEQLDKDIDECRLCDDFGVAGCPLHAGHATDQERDALEGGP